MLLLRHFLVKPAQREEHFVLHDGDEQSLLCSTLRRARAGGLSEAGRARTGSPCLSIASRKTYGVPDPRRTETSGPAGEPQAHRPGDAGTRHPWCHPPQAALADPGGQEGPAVLRQRRPARFASRVLPEWTVRAQPQRRCGQSTAGPQMTGAVAGQVSWSTAHRSPPAPGRGAASLPSSGCGAGRSSNSLVREGRSGRTWQRRSSVIRVAFNGSAACTKSLFPASVARVSWHR